MKIQVLESSDAGPYMHPYSADELLDLIDKAIRYAARPVEGSKHSAVSDSISSKPVYSFFVTSDFEKGLKWLKKSHRTRELDTLKSAISDLAEHGTVQGKYGDHRVGGKYREIKLGDRNVLMTYAIVPGSTIIQISIELSDITDHDGLNDSIRRPHARTREVLNDGNFSADDIIGN